MTISAVSSQMGTEFLGVWTDWPAVGLNLNDIPGPVVGLQYTIPTDQLWRSFTLTITPWDDPPPAGDPTGLLTVNFCRTPAMQPFDNANLPTTQPGLVAVYSEQTTFVSDTPIEIPISFEIDQLQVNSGMGNFDDDSIMSTIRHELFNGTIAFTIAWEDATAALLHSGVAPTSGALTPTLVGDNTPALFSGLPTGHHRLSRADSCPRCGTPIFREQLVRDGYTKSLVCKDCWDRDEERYPPFKPPKEINP